MEILRSIALYTENKDMPFILIGGHAVNAYGLSRQTGDIDLMIPRSNVNLWDTLFLSLKYIKGQSDDRFMRFVPGEIIAWPIDLMIVDDSTFTKMFDDSVEISVGSAQVRVVSARHLATLKIHALKHYQEHRFAKDYNDLVGLLRSGKTGLNESDLKELCVRYANLKLFEKLKSEGGLP